MGENKNKHPQNLRKILECYLEAGKEVVSHLGAKVSVTWRIDDGSIYSDLDKEDTLCVIFQYNVLADKRSREDLYKDEQWNWSDIEKAKRNLPFRCITEPRDVGMDNEEDVLTHLFIYWVGYKFSLEDLPEQLLKRRNNLLDRYNQIKKIEKLVNDLKDNLTLENIKECVNVFNQRLLDVSSLCDDAGYSTFVDELEAYKKDLIPYCGIADISDEKIVVQFCQ